MSILVCCEFCLPFTSIRCSTQKQMTQLSSHKTLVGYTCYVTQLCERLTFSPVLFRGVFRLKVTINNRHYDFCDIFLIIGFKAG